LLLFYLATGMRRAEVISLRGGDLEIEEETMIVASRVKGGDYQGREVEDSSVREALLDYLRASRRLSVLKNNGPLWTRHDRAGRPGAALSSHSFVENLKRYASKAGIGDIHLHQLANIGRSQKQLERNTGSARPPASINDPRLCAANRDQA
jgi:integrase